jgi:hypothetical protein
LKYCVIENTHVNSYCSLYYYRGGSVVRRITARIKYILDGTTAILEATQSGFLPPSLDIALTFTTGPCTIVYIEAAIYSVSPDNFLTDSNIWWADGSFLLTATNSEIISGGVVNVFSGIASNIVNCDAIIKTTEQSPITTIKTLMPDTQQVFQHEPGPWNAVRGGITRTQIAKASYASGSTTIVHTVTAGKTFYLVSFNATLSADASNDVFCRVRNTEDTTVYTFAFLTTYGAGVMVIAQSLPMPIACPAGYDIIISSAVRYGSLAIQGWEE